MKERNPGADRSQPRPAEGKPASPLTDMEPQTWPTGAGNQPAGRVAGAGRRSWSAWLGLARIVLCLAAAGAGGLGCAAWGTEKQTPTPRLALAPATLQPGDTWTSPLDGMLMAYIPAGGFWMGALDSDYDAESNEKPRHEVALDGFWMLSRPCAEQDYRRGLPP